MNIAEWAAHPDNPINFDRLGPMKRRIITACFQWPTHGVTDAEIERLTGEHHGRVSGASSQLRKAGVLAWTGEKRDGFRVYTIADEHLFEGGAK